MLEYAAHDAHFLIHIAHELVKEAKLLTTTEKIQEIYKSMNKKCSGIKYEIR
jgi:ribonuclease D